MSLLQATEAFERDTERACMLTLSETPPKGGLHHTRRQKLKPAKGQHDFQVT